MFNSLKHKLVASILVPLCITLLVGGWAVSNFIRLSSSIDAIMTENYRSIRAAENMMDAIERQDTALLLILLGEVETGRKMFIENEVNFLKWLGLAADNITVPGEDEVIAGITSEYAMYLEDSARTLAAEKPVLMNSFYMENLYPRLYKVKGLIQNLLSLNHDAMTESHSKATASAGRAVVSTLMVILAATVVSLGLALNLSERIIRPIRVLMNSVRKIAAGDLNHTITVDSADEIGQLAREFNLMTAKLREYGQANIDRMIAEKKRSDAIVRSISDGIIVTDADNHIALINPAAAEMLEINESDVPGKHFLEILKDEKIFSFIRGVLEGRTGLQLQDSYFSTRRKGKQQHYQVQVTPVNNKEGERIGVVTLFQDVTSLKEVDDIKSDFVSTVSHEFRTPLTSIQMSIGLLREKAIGGLTANQQELMQIVEEDTARLTRLVNDLLNLSKIESGKISMEIGPVKVKTLIDSAANPLLVQAKDKQINLKLHQNEPELLVRADPAKISWVLSNLLGNAIRYTPPNGSITISSEVRGSKVYISVSDNGPGIPKKYHNSIFEKFVQVKENLTSGGAGLGLAIAKEIVDAHGGRIWVDSEPGKGSVFTFTLQKEPENNSPGEGEHENTGGG